MDTKPNSNSIAVLIESYSLIRIFFSRNYGNENLPMFNMFAMLQWNGKHSNNDWIYLILYLVKILSNLPFTRYCYRFAWLVYFKKLSSGEKTHFSFVDNSQATNLVCLNLPVLFYQFTVIIIIIILIISVFSSTVIRKFGL